MLNEIFAEFIGTFLLLLLGNGVVANVVLRDTKGSNGGWIVISLGWGLGVFVGVTVAGPVSGAHINPAVTLGLAAAGNFAWSQVLPFIGAQMAGAAAGAGTVWLFYRHHFDRTEDSGAQLACFSTGPAIRAPFNNFLSELIGTFVLIFVILYIADPSIELETGGSVKMGLGALGGTTGYAINPARDLSPRIMHTLLPMKHKGSSDWGYAWIPVAGPFVGALVAAGFFLLQGVVIR
jgi:glycerol uptake facilitator protein